MFQRSLRHFRDESTLSFIKVLILAKHSRESQMSRDLVPRHLQQDGKHQFPFPDCFTHAAFLLSVK